MSHTLARPLHDGAPTMTRHHLSKRLSAVAALVLLLAAPSIGLAQNAGASGASGAGGIGGSSSTSSGKIGVQILKIGGEDQSDNLTKYLGLDDCLDDDGEIEFRIDNFPSDKQLDIYVGSDCFQVTARDGEGTDCDIVLMGEDLSGTQNQIVTLNTADLVNLALGTNDCGSQRSTVELWFLAVDMPGGNEALNSADYYGKEDLNIDTDPPDAPTSIKGGSGENQIPVEWSVGTNSVDRFEIYIDRGDGTGVADASTEPVPSDEDGGAEPSAGGATATDCGTGALHAGDSTEGLESFPKETERSATATSTLLNAGQIGGTSAAVAVVAIDEAGNRSPLSEVVCVYVKPTTGFKDAFEDENGEIPQGCPCAAAGPAQLEGALPIALALGLIAYRRRRRS